MLPASHTTLANSTADAVGYAPGVGLGVDGAPQGGGHRDEVRGQPADPMVIVAGRAQRIEVRRPWFDVRWVLRDWNGMGSLDTFDRATRRVPTVRADNNRASTVAGLPFDTSPVIERGTIGAWDEGSEVKAKAGTWW